MFIGSEKVLEDEISIGILRLQRTFCFIMRTGSGEVSRTGSCNEVLLAKMIGVNDLEPAFLLDCTTVFDLAVMSDSVEESDSEVSITSFLSLFLLRIARTSFSTSRKC